MLGDMKEEDVFKQYFIPKPHGFHFHLHSGTANYLVE